MLTNVLSNGYSWIHWNGTKRIWEQVNIFMFDLTSRLCLRCAQLWAGGFIQAEESTQELLWRWPGTLGWGASSCRMSLSCKHEAASLVLVKYCIYAMCLYTVGLGDQTESLLIVAWRDVWLGDLHSVLNNLFYLFIECYHSKHTELPSPRREAFYLRITSSACWFSTRWKEHLATIVQAAHPSLFIMRRMGEIFASFLFIQIKTTIWEISHAGMVRRRSCWVEMYTFH